MASPSPVGTPTTTISPACAAEVAESDTPDVATTVDESTTAVGESTAAVDEYFTQAPVASSSAESTPSPVGTPTTTSPACVAKAAEPDTPDIATAVEQSFTQAPVASDSAESTIAFAFDVDGVLVRGTNAISGARETLQLLRNNGIPFILLTNGGGFTEVDHAAKVSSRLGINIDPEQFVQSHSPFHDIVPLYRDKKILVMGGAGNNIRDLAEAYGFRDVVTTSDLLVQFFPEIHPFPEMTKTHHSTNSRRSSRPLREISAILVWSSPRDWCLDLQVLSDLMLSSGGIFGHKSLKAGDISLPNNGYLQDGQPKLYFCNGDFEWVTNHFQPRFAQGAFREAFRGIWNYATKGDAELEYTVIGKPTETTYVYGEKKLQAYNEKLASQDQRPVPSIKTVYMVGDNPESDIAGANNYESRIPGAEWRSILVETGVHEAGTKPSVQPHHTAFGVAEAVKLALQQESVVVAGVDRLVTVLEPPPDGEQKAPHSMPLDPDVLPETFGDLKLDIQPKGWM